MFYSFVNSSHIDELCTPTVRYSNPLFTSPTGTSKFYHAHFLTYTCYYCLSFLSKMSIVLLSSPFCCKLLFNNRFSLVLLPRPLLLLLEIHHPHQPLYSLPNPVVITMLTLVVPVRCVFDHGMSVSRRPE